MTPRALRTFTVRARLPEALAPLHEIAMNLRWSWDSRSRDLFRWVDPVGWERSRHDPVLLLSLISRQRLDELVQDAGFMEFLGEVHGDLHRYKSSPRWFQRHESPLQSVAYFSPEFGISEALPQYSGGLGVLAGDHLKAASGLGVPIIGVGLFYREGYFRQGLNADGWQEERYVTLDPHTMALNPIESQVKIEMAGTPLVAQIWRAEVGRIPLYFLDTDVEDNPAELRGITDRLYGGGEERRIQQEILLGVGGMRALQVVGEIPQVFHMNEGHAGFLALEQIRLLMTEEGLSFEEAIESARASIAFTTHTPVPAGIDLFSIKLMERYFTDWCNEVGLPFDRLMDLGHPAGASKDAPFNMAIMCLRLSGKANGVSKLHGDVSRQMFHSLWQGVPIDEVPILSVTNGIHARTWVSPGMTELFDRYVLPEWNEAGPERWQKIEDARDDEIWRVREHERETLISFVRERLRETAIAQGVSEMDLEWCDEVLDPHFLTIGFARRFAEYKRATLLLSQPERLRALLLSDQPIQLVFAGKAHPADDFGKQMIRQIVQFSRDPSVRHRIAFIEDYDIAVARALYQGCDVWLNNPRRPLEACGTSGEKAALNGVLNVSTLDGWWDEMYDGQNGWAIASAENYEDLDRRDEVEAASLFDLLERHIIPAFYEKRTESQVPTRWIKHIKASLASLGSEVSASRMVRDYITDLYEPLADQTSKLSADGRSKARQLAAWKIRVRDCWPGVAIGSVDSDVTAANLGTSRDVTAMVTLGELTREDVQVQLVHGLVGVNDELQATQITNMALGDGNHDEFLRYEGSFPCDTAGRYGFAVRVVPFHEDLISYAETGCITWA